MASKKANQRPRKSKAQNPIQGSSGTAPRSVAPIVNEPTGIERDFIHLWHTVRFGLNYALANEWQQSSAELRLDNAQTRTRRDDTDELFCAIDAQATRSELIRSNAQRDMLGVEPYALFDNALPKEYTPPPDLQQVLDKWVSLYLQRVHAITYRWKEKAEAVEVDTRLSTLCDQVRSLEPFTPHFEGAASVVKTSVEGAKRKIVEGITANLTLGTSNATAQQEHRVPWNDTAALLAYLLTELIEAEYITPPPNGRRTGKEGNRAAVADLAYQLFDIRDRSTNERVTREYFRSLLRPNSPDRDSRADLFKIRPRVARNEPT